MRAASVARTELALASLEANFRCKARESVGEMRRVLDAIVPEDADRLGIENYVRLARIGDLATDIAAQLGFFGNAAVADLAGRIGRRSVRKDCWDSQALDLVGRQIDALATMLGTGPERERSSTTA